ncbi:hypothetical protein RclHR1_05480003 [Rhizophagus clarus]|uniref:Uncharacterized protein n=1 Tax=Rhizophagus clarus TaxID=94130 RepID=A0A2Z6S4E8_9GLOM|nr:hypothetical protein RclHR1_05480003 [Rhizophagus clarus]
MAFKRIMALTNEWEISAYLPRVQKNLTFARIFTNIESPLTHIKICLKIYLDVFIADQHKGQALGLGQYLNSRYLHLTPTEHLENVDKNKQLSNEIRNSMYLIPTLDTKDDVLAVIDKIQNCGESEAAAWAKDKLTPWVLSGISSAFTKMDRTIWNKTPNNTNVGESAHENVNRDGRNLSILAGVIRQRACFDKRQWESVNVYEQYNVPDSYRDKSELARQIQQDEKRAEKRRKCKQSSGIIKKQKSNSRNKENVIKITDDENPRLVGLEQQKKINSLEQEMLNIQKQKNDELEREITLIEKRNRLLGL